MPSFSTLVNTSINGEFGGYCRTYPFTVEAEARTSLANHGSFSQVNFQLVEITERIVLMALQYLMTILCRRTSLEMPTDLDLGFLTTCKILAQQ